MSYPVKVKCTAAFLMELTSCELGRYNDAEQAREAGDKELISENGYGVVFCDFSSRWKTQIECRNDAELVELYYVCASGTIGLRGYSASANRILDQIRERVATIDPEMVKRWRRQDGF